MIFHLGYSSSPSRKVGPARNDRTQAVMTDLRYLDERKPQRPTSARMEAARRMLDNHYLFARLPTKTRDTLWTGAQRLAVRSRATLFHSGDRVDLIYLVLDGAVTLFRTSSDGQERVIDIIYPGETVAEETVFMADRRYPMSASAARACSLLTLPATPYLRALKNHPGVCLDVLANLSSRLHQRLTKVDDLAMRSAPQRVLRYLLDQLPARAQSVTEIQLSAPKRVIASKLAIQPETFSRILRRLTETGSIEVRGRTIVVRDPDLLQTAQLDAVS